MPDVRGAGRRRRGHDSARARRPRASFTRCSRLPRARRAAVRVLHARDDPDRAPGTSSATRAPTARSCARRSAATCAAAPATRRSSTRSRRTATRPREAPVAIERDPTLRERGRATASRAPPRLRREGRGHAPLRRRLGLSRDAPRGRGPGADPVRAHQRRSTSQAARAVRGVHAVMTARDIPHNVIAEEASGLGIDAIVQPVLAADRVRYDGEPVAIIAAETPRRPRSRPRRWSRSTSRSSRACSMPRRRSRPTRRAVHAGGNRTSRGARDRRRGGGDGARRRRRRGDLPQPTRRPRLPRARGRDRLDRRDGVLTLRVSTQVIEHVGEIADDPRAPHSRVRVIAAYMGGGFGGKEDMTVEPYLALLVWKTRRPVRMVWTRQESLLARQKRHPFTMRYRTGRRRRHDRRPGHPDRRRRRRVPAAQLAGAVRRGRQRDRPLPVRRRPGGERRRLHEHACRRARCAGSARCRCVFAYESQMDRIAQGLGLDPRCGARNATSSARGDRRVTDEEIDTRARGVRECMRRALEELGDRSAPSNGGKRRAGVRVQHAALRPLGALRRPRVRAGSG